MPIDNNLSDVKIVGWKEVNRFKKKTVVYIINYRYNNKQGKSLRSYREFHALYKYLQETYKEEVLPRFPENKSKNDYLD